MDSSSFSSQYDLVRQFLEHKERIENWLYMYNIFLSTLSLSLSLSLSFSLSHFLSFLLANPSFHIIIIKSFSLSPPFSFSIAHDLCPISKYTRNNTYLPLLWFERPTINIFLIQFQKNISKAQWFWGQMHHVLDQEIMSLNPPIYFSFDGSTHGLKGGVLREMIWWVVS